MSHVAKKIFRLDDTLFQDEVLQPFNQLYERKKDKVTDFYKELIDIPDMQDFQIDLKPQKFSHHSMCLSLDSVCLIYSFFKLYLEKFSTSKQSVVVLTKDIDYMKKEQKIMMPQDAQENIDVEYYMFFKSVDKSSKMDKIAS